MDELDLYELNSQRLHPLFLAACVVSVGSVSCLEREDRRQDTGLQDLDVRRVGRQSLTITKSDGGHEAITQES